MSEGFIATLARQAGRLYGPGDRFARHFATGKIRADPAFGHLLGAGLIPTGARVLDLGCGQGVLAALLIAARGVHARGEWPAGWPPPPRPARFHGIDLSHADLGRARRACGGEATFEQADIRDYDFGNADVVVLVDVLHYIDREAQEAVLRKAAAALRGGGTLLMRVADADDSLRFRCTVLADHIATFLRHGRAGRMHCRPLAQWRRALESLGFEVEARPMSAGTPFANVLLVARYHPPHT